MQIVGTPPRLSKRAAQQLGILGTDRALGFQRLRAISRSIRVNEERIAVLRAEKDGNERTQEQCAPYPALREKAAAAAAAIRDACAEIHSLEERVEAYEREIDAINVWHTPVVRVLEDLLTALGGFSDVSQLLPDFDDGITAELQLIREAAEQAARAQFTPPRSFR